MVGIDELRDSREVVEDGRKPEIPHREEKKPGLHGTTNPSRLTGRPAQNHIPRSHQALLAEPLASSFPSSNVKIAYVPLQARGPRPVSNQSSDPDSPPTGPRPEVVWEM